MNQIQTLEDKVECLSIFVAKADTVQQIHDEIKKVFDVSRGKIKLSTVHKAKGLEADNVYILATNRMPHPRGGAEENNICYVAITRAKKIYTTVAISPVKYDTLCGKHFRHLK